MPAPTLPAGITADVMRAAALVDAGWPVGPRPHTCTVCGRDRGAHNSDRGCDGYMRDPAEALAEQALEVADRQWLDDLADARRAGYRPSGRSGPRVSDYGACPRQVWYREQPPADYTPAYVDERRATLGGIVHEAAEKVRRELYPWRLYEYELAIPGLDKPGRVDEYDPVLGEVTDGKTAGDHKWAVYGEDGPPVEAWGQVLIYAYTLDMLGYPVRTVRIIAVNRDTGAEEHFRAAYDPEEAIAALDDLLELATQLDLGIVPPRAGTGPGRFPCSWCPARLHCWNVDAAQAAGRSPESYTLLGVEPTDPTIAWAAERAYRATKANTAAKNAKDERAALLEGIPFGVYGDWEIKPAGRTVPDYKAAYERLAGLYVLPDEHRPALEHVERPVRRERWVAVKPVRAAERETKPRARARKAQPAE